MPGDFKYKAFISYSWADRQWGEWLHHALETYRAPKSLGGARLHPIFKDREEEAAGHSIGSAIEAALGSSEFLVVLCSPNSAKSKWVNREVAWFKTHRDARKILTLIVAGEPHASDTPGREAEECFPRTLLYKVDADLAATDEFEDAPLAADARETGDGRRGAKLKLAAAMLGVGYDALARRDDRRRAQRRRAAMGAMAALVAVLSGITLYAVNQRDAAIGARKIAEAAEKDAKFQADEAQSLVEFMLTDLRQRLDAVGRLDILDSVAKRLLESYEKQDLATLDPDALGRRARVLLLLGEVEGTRGKLDAALARYKDAAATTEELLRRAPDDQQRIFDHAQSVYWVGDIAWKRGDVALTAAQWTQYRDYGARLVKLDPDKDEWRTELGYGHRNLGVLAYTEGEASDAVEAFRRARDVSKALSEKHADDANLQIAYADDLIWLASAQEKAGAFAEAEETLAAEAAISGALLAKDPENDMALQRQSVNGRMAARLAIEQGDARRSLEILNGLVPLHEARIAHDLENTAWQDFLSLLKIDLANTTLALGDIAASRQTADKAIAAARRLIQIDSRVANWNLTNLGLALQTAARAAIADGDMLAASDFAAEAQSLVDHSNITLQETAPMRRFEAATALIRAIILKDAGDYAGSKSLAKTASEELGPLYEKSSPAHRHVIVELILRSGDTKKAGALAEQLHALGYRHPDFMKLRIELASQKGGR